MKTPTKHMLATLLCASASVAFAATETITWTNIVTAGRNLWTTKANWTNEAGEVVTEVPVNGENVAFADMPALPSSAPSTYLGQMRVSTGQSGYSSEAVNPVIGTLTGDARHEIWVDNSARAKAGCILGYYVDDYVQPTHAGMQTLSDGTKARVFDVTNPNGFKGWVRPITARTHLYLRPTTTFTPVLENLLVALRPFVDVPNDRAEIVNAYGGNTLDKVGAGTLVVKSFNSENTRVILKAGTLELGGHDSDALAKLLEKSAIWLDASQATTLTKYTDDDGTRVSEWRDVRGGADAGYRYAGAPNYHSPSYWAISSSTNPIYRADTPFTGLALLDMGERVGGSTTTVGGCLKIFPSNITGIRAAFYVASCPNGADNVTILGDTGSYHFMPGVGNTLYSATYAAPAIRHADISLNMRKTSFGGDGDIAFDELTALHVVGQDTSGMNATVGLLGSREYYRATTGGARIGEVILFTNELTRAERMIVANYLNAKWRVNTTASELDLASVYAPSTATANLGVTAGGTARIGAVRAEKGVLNKTGAGRLEIGSVSPSTTTYTVEGGELAFKKPVVTTDKPASDPYNWFDATKLDPTLTLVEEWPDARSDVDRKAVTKWTEEGHVPRLITSDLVGGKQVVDFGGWNESATQFNPGQDAAAMKLPNYDSGAPYVYSYFCMMRVSPKSVNAPNHTDLILPGMSYFWTAGMAQYHDSSTLASTGYWTAFAQPAQWHVDGLDVDPYTFADFYYSNYATNSFRLITIVSTSPVVIDRLCMDRNGYPWKGGGQELAEVLTYARTLSPEEVRNTEAYLMKKWLGKDHPSQASLTPATVTFGDDVVASIETDADMTVGAISGGNGSYVKKGAGLVTASSVNVAATNIVVTEGGMTIPLGAGTFFDEATFDFDASNLAKSDYTVVEGVTNVTRWTDVRGNGWSALADSNTLATQLPKIVTVETKEGSGRYIQALDFGKYSWRTNEYYEINGSASMVYQKNGSTSSQKFKELFMIFADAKDDHRTTLFGSTADHGFQRDWTNGKLMFNVSTYEGKSVSGLRADGIPLNSRITYLDGKIGAPYNLAISAGFHSLEWPCAVEGRTIPSGWGDGCFFNAIGRVKGSLKANASNWGYDYNLAWDDCGGILVAEQIAFQRLLTQAEADYMNAYLNWKWFGGTFPGYYATNVLDRVSVAAGASLALVDTDIYGITLTKIKEIEGTGSLSIPKVALSAIDATVKNGSTDHLNLLGTVTLDTAMTVNVTADLTSGLIRYGQYPILTATTLEGFDKATFTVNILTSGSGIYEASVVKQGNTLYLNVAKRGLIMLIQ